MRKSFKDVKDLFGDLLGKPITVSVGGKTLDLKIKMSDIHSFMTLKNDPEKPGLSKEDSTKIENTLRQILQRSYIPSWDSKNDSIAVNLTPEQEKENEDTESMLEEFLIRNFLVLFTEIGIALGWGKREELEETRAISKNRISPMPSEESL